MVFNYGVPGDAIRETQERHVNRLDSVKANVTTSPEIIKGRHCLSKQTLD